MKRGHRQLLFSSRTRICCAAAYLVALVASQVMAQAPANQAMFRAASEPELPARLPPVDVVEADYPQSFPRHDSAAGEAPYATRLLPVRLPLAPPAPPPAVTPPPTELPLVRPAVRPAAYQPPAEPNAPPPVPPRAPTEAEAVAPPTPDMLRPDEPWTLPRLTRLAELYNPVLRRALARIESAQGDALQASLYPNPRFDTNNPEVFAGPYSSYNVGFMQDIVVKGKIRLNRAAAVEVVRQKELSLVRDRFDMLTALRKQFYSTLASQRRVAVMEEIVHIAQGSVRAAEGRMQAGEGTETEVLLVTTELQRSEYSLRSAQTVVIGQLKQLAALVGLPELVIPQVSGELTQGFPNFDENSIRNFVVGENAQVQVARREIARNQLLLQRAEVEPYPNIRVGPAYNYMPVPMAGGNQFWFTLQFDIPMWDRNQGNIRSTQADVRDSVASLGVLQNDLLRQAADALSRYRAARQRAERIQTSILPNARRAQQLVRDGYLKGVLDISTFLQAQRTLSDTTVDYFDALEEVWTTAADLANLLQLEQFP